MNGQVMRERGQGAFADELARFAAANPDPRVSPIAERTAAPLRVVVRGRRGVGRATVARALDRAGRASNLAVTAGDGDGCAVDVVVYVTAEVVKPEDLDAIAAARRVVTVLNKADLIGPVTDGPVAAARLRCAQLSAAAGVPVQPIVGSLAVAALGDLDRECWAALRTLATHPGGAACLDGSHAGFLTAPNPVPADQRLRLLATLDLFGVAIGIAALRRGRTPAQVRALLRRLSGVDAVVRSIRAAGAEVRYRRVLDAVADLEALAVSRGPEARRVGDFLARDGTVLARMADAVEVAGAVIPDPAESGPGPDRDDAAGHLRRAARWQQAGRRTRHPVSELHRACGADIVRGSLRLWLRGGGSPGDFR